MEKKPMLTRPLVVAFLAGFCCLLWGSAIPFINLGYRLFSIESGETATQILFAGCRFFLAGALTVLITSIGERRFVKPRRENRDKVVKLALAQTITQYVFFYIGVAHTTSVKGSIIQGLNAFVAILIACYLFRSERMNRLKWIGGLIGVAGIILVNFDGTGLDGSFSFLGEGFLIISMAASACSTGLIKRYGQTEDPVALSGWQFMTGGAAMAVCAAIAGGRLHPQSPMAGVVLLYLAALSATAYSLWAVLLKVNPVSRVAVYTFLQPIFGVLLSLLLVDSGADVPLLRYGAALVLICLSIVIVGRGQREDA
ncbi:MAG: DMT family transporter [Clostridia bacterium]|nr:DMT family transporter [Clostridia bacterium]